MTKSNASEGAARGSSEYMRGLRAAAALVSLHSGERRDAGEMTAMYALNTVWHAIDELVRSEERYASPEEPKATRRKAPSKAVAAVAGAPSGGEKEEK